MKCKCGKDKRENTRSCTPYCGIRNTSFGKSLCFIQSCQVKCQFHILCPHHWKKWQRLYGQRYSQESEMYYTFIADQ